MLFAKKSEAFEVKEIQMPSLNHMICISKHDTPAIILQNHYMPITNKIKCSRTCSVVEHLPSMYKLLDFVFNIGEVASKGGVHNYVEDPENLAGVFKFKAVFRIALWYS